MPLSTIRLGSIDFPTHPNTFDAMSAPRRSPMPDTKTALTPAQRKRLNLVRKVGTAAATVLSVDQNDVEGTRLYTQFREDQGHENPIRSCQNFQRSLEPDWPGHDWAIIPNDRAKFLMWVERMAAIIGEESSAEDYVRLDR